MKRSRQENLLGLRLWVHTSTPDKEVFGAPFYCPSPDTPARNLAHSVRPGRGLALRRRAHRGTPHAGLGAGAGRLARGRLDPGGDVVGLSQPSPQPRRFLSLDRQPRAGLAGLPRRATLFAADRPLLQGAAALA